MKVIILAGGRGTRIAEYSKTIPKPMIKIGNTPILIHIINHYLSYGLKDFYIAIGYKGYVIKNYFKKFTIKNDKNYSHSIFKNKCNIKLIETGLKTLTGGRLKKLEKYISDEEEFMFTYGDGISDVNLKKLLIFHKKKKTITTVTAVHPPARFGEIILDKLLVRNFKEKPQVREGWINEGFFVSNKQIFKYISGDKEILEKKPLEKLTARKQLAAFKHTGFWKCMDTVRDRDVLIELYKKNKLRFKKKN